MFDRFLRFGLGLTDMAMLGGLFVLCCMGLQRLGCGRYFYPSGPPPLCRLGVDEPGDMLAMLLASPLFAVALVHGCFVIFSPETKEFRAIAGRCVVWWLATLVLGIAILVAASALARNAA